MMILTEDQITQLEEASKPLVKFLCDNFHHHVYVIVNPTGVEMVQGIASVKIEEFIKD